MIHSSMKVEMKVESNLFCRIASRGSSLSLGELQCEIVPTYVSLGCEMLLDQRASIGYSKLPCVGAIIELQEDGLVFRQFPGLAGDVR